MDGDLDNNNRELERIVLLAFFGWFVLWLGYNLLAWAQRAEFGAKVLAILD